MTVESLLPQQAALEAVPHAPRLPFSGWSFSMGSAYQFHSWRVFVIVCALPCVCSVVALTFMPESPRFLLEVTLVITDTQRSHVREHWEVSCVNSGRRVCLLGRCLFPFPLWSCGAFAFMETCFQQPACAKAVSRPESKWLVVQWGEHDLLFYTWKLYHPKVLFLIIDTSFELLCTQGYPSTLWVPIGRTKLAVNPISSGNARSWLRKSEGTSVHLTVCSHLLGWETWWSLDDSEVNSWHKHESPGSAWEGLHGEYGSSENPLPQGLEVFFGKGWAVNSFLSVPATPVFQFLTLRPKPATLLLYVLLPRYEMFPLVTKCILSGKTSPDWWNLDAWNLWEGRMVFKSLGVCTIQLGEKCFAQTF